MRAGRERRCLLLLLFPGPAAELGSAARPRLPPAPPPPGPPPPAPLPPPPPAALLRPGPARRLHEPVAPAGTALAARGRAEPGPPPAAMASNMDREMILADFQVNGGPWGRGLSPLSLSARFGASGALWEDREPLLRSFISPSQHVPRALGPRRCDVPLNSGSSASRPESSQLRLAPPARAGQAVRGGSGGGRARRWVPARLCPPRGGAGSACCNDGRTLPSPFRTTACLCRKNMPSLLVASPPACEKR